MVYSGVNPRPMRPEEANPWAGAISKAMEGIKEGVHTAYLPKKMETDILHKQIINAFLPQMQEAEIFGKQFSPLASLATSPMFLQNPQFQKMLGQLIAQNPGMAGLQGGGSHGGQGGQGTQRFINEAPTYAEQANLDLADAQKLADDISKQGKIKGFISSAGGGIKSYGGELGNAIISHLPKKVQELLNPQLAANIHKFETYLTGLKNRAIQTHVMTEAQANKEFSEHEDENALQRLERIRRIAPSLFQQGNVETPQQEEENTENVAMDKEDENHNDNELLTKASKLSDEIKEKKGYDIDPQFIVNYYKANPGRINIEQLLKTAAVTR